MHRIVFLDRGSIRAEFRKPSFEHEWVDFDQTAPTEIESRLSNATIAITNKAPLRDETLSQLPSLKMIAVCATGYDIVDIESCRSRGIAVANVRGYAANTLPEHVFMLMLALRRNLLSYRQDLSDGAWQRAPHFTMLNHRIHDMHGSTLGLIGYGSLARGLERLALAFGMKVLIAERRGASEIRDGRTSFEEVLKVSDCISLHAPLTNETRNIIGVAELGMMKPDAVLINTGRGGLVNEEALADAILDNRIGGAGVDVLTKEPPTGGNPLLEIQSPRLIVTPHIAWASDEAMQILADAVVDNIEAFVSGRPLSRIV
jgi:glycerate dehydrogenase